MKDQIDVLEKEHNILVPVNNKWIARCCGKKKCIERIEKGSATFLIFHPEKLRSQSTKRMLLLRRHIARFVIWMKPTVIIMGT